MVESFELPETWGYEIPREKWVSKNPPFWLKNSGIKKCSLDVLVDGFGCF